MGAERRRPRLYLQAPDHELHLGPRNATVWLMNYPSLLVRMGISLAVAGGPCFVLEIGAAGLGDDHPCRCERPHTHTDIPASLPTPSKIGLGTNTDTSLSR